MDVERFEWLEIPEEKRVKSEPKGETPDVSAKRCPKCGWLDHISVVECFRCGYDYQTGHLYRDFLKNRNLEIPEPVMKVTSDFNRILNSRRVASYRDYLLRLQVEEHALIKGFDKLISLSSSNIIHYQHQLDTAYRVLNQMRGQALLADEVGLGKTIEAGIIMKELLERGLIKKILILTPASLVTQWQEELLTKFGETFIIAENPADWKEDKVIASLSKAQRPEIAKLIYPYSYDLLIIDEAHKLKSRFTQRFKFVNQIKKKYVLMLTATPVHNDLTELYSLVTILKPGLLGTIRAFKRQYVSKQDPRQPKNEARLKKLLSEVMVRNRRSSVGIQFPSRRAAIYHFNLTPEEQRLYQEVTNYIREEFKAETRNQYHLLSLTTLQKELCSSARAVKATLAKMADRQQYPRITRQRFQFFMELADKIRSPRKVEALLEIIHQFKGKFVIFTEFLNTLFYLQETLEAHGISTRVFHGGMSLSQRLEAIRDLERSAQVLISTQAGGEGLNLQFCHQMINYDLPWNPMMVEQRIGRLHRLGQSKEVLIFNLSTNATIEAHILELLAKKIRLFELVIGELDLILGAVDDKRSFEQVITDIWISSQNNEELDQRFQELGNKILKARQKFRKIKEAEAILSEIFEQEI